MATISTVQFLKIADRLSAQYELLVTAETEGNLPENQASLLVPGAEYLVAAFLEIDPTGLSNNFLVRATTPGNNGNDILITFEDPSASNYPLEAVTFGTDVIVLIETDNGGNLISSTQEVVDLLNSHPSFTHVEGILVDDGSGTIDASIAGAFLDSGQGDNSFTIKAVSVGAEGNDLTLTLVDPGAISQSLTLTLTGNDLVVSLATDGSGLITTTPALLKVAVEADFEINSIFAIELYEDGTDAVFAFAQTNLAGGLNGPYVNSVLQAPPGATDCTADSDVALMTSSAQDADNNFTAPSLSKGIQVMENLLGALGTHMSRTGASNTQVYLTDNDLLVHESYSLMEGNRVGTTLNAVNVFRKDVIGIGTFDVLSPNVVLTPGTPLGTGSGVHSSTNYAAQKMKATLTPIHSKSSVVMTPSSGTLNRLLWTAKYPGIPGNNLNVTYTDPSAINQTLTLSVSSNWDIDVSLATDGGGSITTTAAEILAEIAIVPGVEALVDVTNYLTDDGTGIVTALGNTSLTGALGPNLTADLNVSITLTDKDLAPKTITDIRWDAKAWPNVEESIAQKSYLTTTAVTDVNDQIRFVAKTGGADGNSITITYVDPGSGPTALSIVVSGTDITVNLETDGGPAIISTATEVKAAIDADTDASALVYADLPGTGAGVVAAFTQVNLANGEDADRYFTVTDGTLVVAGTDGDSILIQQVVERVVTV